MVEKENCVKIMNSTVKNGSTSASISAAFKYIF